MDRRNSLWCVFLVRVDHTPVEFNASARALNQLVSHGIIENEEQVQGVKNVLSAAAWTYVAAAMSAIGTWQFYVVLMLGSRGRRAV
jgi:Zn-dependent membrane protease YugP